MSEKEEFVSGNIKFSLFGEPIEMEMSVPANPVKPMRMLPILHAMTNSFVGIGESAAEANGEKISCEKGCGACCRQPVPIAESEVYQIAGLVENLPEPRRSEIKKKFADGAAHFHKNKWFERMDGYAALSEEDRKKLVLEYFYEGIACPFLEDESCSIHQERPLSCREYLVTSPAENCSKPSADTVKMIKIPVKCSESLRKMSPTNNLTKLNFIPMIRSLEWAGSFPDAFEEKTGEQWMADFFKNLKTNG